jgi:hypothetical protein
MSSRTALGRSHDAERQRGTSELLADGRSRTAVAGVEDAVQVANAIEHEPHRLRGVQVVVHRLAERRQEGCRLAGERTVEGDGGGGAARGLVGAGKRLVESHDRPLRLLEASRGEVERRAVVRAEIEQSQGLGGRPLRHLGDRQDVAQRLGHLFGARGDHPVVHPEAREGPTGVGLRLRDLVLVVREDQVGAAAMDVESLAQVALRHGRALEVPAGSPRAPRAVPRRLARLGSLPEREVVNVLLVGIDLLARRHVVEPLMRQLAVLREAPHAEVDAAVAHRVGEVLRDQPLDQGDHVVDVLGRARLVRRPQALEPRGVLAEGGDLTLRQRARGQALLSRTPDDLVVDVGEVANERDGRSACAQVAAEDVHGDERPGVADVRARVDRDAAPVDADPPRRARHEGLLATGEGVGENQPHRDYSSSSRSLARTE